MKLDKKTTAFGKDANPAKNFTGSGFFSDSVDFSVNFSKPLKTETTIKWPLKKLQ